MGSFGGHALPGSFFIMFALWHAVQISVRYFKSKVRSGIPYKSCTYFLSPCCGEFPLESFLKVTSCTVGILVETIAGMSGGIFKYIGNSQHITMFFFFGLAGLLEILHFYRFHLPPNLLYLSYLLAFVIEALLFYFHLHGRKPMDVQLHMLLLLVVVATAGVLFVEMHRRRSVLAALCRVYLVLLQGLWFWQVAFILYPPSGMEKWDLKDHDQMMICTVIFSSHAGFSLILILFIWFTVACRFGQCRISKENVEYSSLAMNVLQGKAKNGNGDRIRLVEAEAESEDELFTSGEYK